MGMELVKMTNLLVWIAYCLVPYLTGLCGWFHLVVCTALLFWQIICEVVIFSYKLETGDEPVDMTINRELGDVRDYDIKLFIFMIVPVVITMLMYVNQEEGVWWLINLVGTTLLWNRKLIYLQLDLIKQLKK